MAVPNKDMLVGNSIDRKRTEGQLQKPVGMAWGSNAPSKAHQNKRSASSFDDFGKYMAEKKRKLILQYQAEACDNDASVSHSTDLGLSSCPAELSTGIINAHLAIPCNDSAQLFNGISIFVDGLTTPSHQELRDLMLKHGGIFQNYFSRDMVTHIICTTLPDSKIKDHRSFSRGLPIVKPSWIVDSIACGRLLPTSSYAHERIAYSHPNQLTVSRFFDTKKEDTRPSFIRESEDVMLSHEEMHSEREECIIDNDGLDTKHLHSTKNFAEPKLDLKVSVFPSTSDDKMPLRSSGHIRSHCTLDDANFVQNYFKNSRLHFIGTWRTRYQNRFQNSSEQKTLEFEKTNLLSDCGERIIMHVDMDCFFVAVVVRDRPELVGKPVVVCHSEKTQGTAEISSSNYAARAFGIRSGMFIGDAKALCPELVVVPYDFEGYEQVADQFYDVLHKHCKKVQAVSCDEAYVDVTGVEDPEALASQIRKEVFGLTRCTASIGIAENLLLARIATRKAKPDGQFRIVPLHVEELLLDFSVKDLPGVGWSLQERLHSKGIYVCKQLRVLSKDNLQHEFGVKTGEMLWCYARGIDNREVTSHQERKSIGAEVNWGVRFNSTSDAQHFLTTLCEEVSARLQNALVAGRTFSLKIKKRKEGATEPHKFMGCGSCDNLSKSITLGCATNQLEVILRVSRQIFGSFNLDVSEIRGMGLQVTRLESNTTGHIDGGHLHQKGMESCLQSFPKGTLRETAVELKNLDQESKETLSSEPVHPLHVCKENSVSWGIDRSKLEQKKGIQVLGKVRKGPFTGMKQSSFERQKGKQNLTFLPHHSELDQTVLASLPPDIIAELDDVYRGAVSKQLSSFQNPQCMIGSTITGELPAQIQGFPFSVAEESCCSIEKPQKASLAFKEADLKLTVPLALSQVDMATFNELPLELKKEILRSLPAHSSNPDSMNELGALAASDTPKWTLSSREISDVTSSSPNDVVQLDGLWHGDPPKWVMLFEKIQGSGSNVLHLLSKSFYESGCPKELSTILLHAVCPLKVIAYKDVDRDKNDTVTLCCLELFKQYILSEISCNLEEVFTALRVLKRLSRAEQFWEKLLHKMIPFIQEATREAYGAIFVTLHC